MKRLLIIVMILLCGTCMAQSKKASKNPTQTAVINIPGWCCKSLNPTITNTLAYEKGVTKWDLDQPNKKLTITFNPKKTSPEKVEKALAENGVRTEHFKPNPRAIKDLPKCCQPAAKGENSHCK